MNTLCRTFGLGRTLHGLRARHHEHLHAPRPILRPRRTDAAARQVRRAAHCAAAKEHHVDRLILEARRPASNTHVGERLVKGCIVGALRDAGAVGITMPGFVP